MRVIVDTSVWSLALRRDTQPGTGPIEELRSLIRDHRVQMIGPIRQEVLSGIRDQAQFEKLQEYLQSFPDFPIPATDYVNSARFYNTCRAQGVQGSNTGFLICAVAVRGGFSIFTTDNDFLLFARHLPITLHRTEQASE